MVMFVPSVMTFGIDSSSISALTIEQSFNQTAASVSFWVVQG